MEHSSGESVNWNLPFKHELWLLAGLILVAIVAVCVSSCTTPEQWEASIYSARFEVGSLDQSLDWHNSKHDSDLNGAYLAVSWGPLDYWRRQEDAKAMARAVTEAMYRVEMERREGEQPSGVGHQEVNAQPWPESQSCCSEPKTKPKTKSKVQVQGQE